jgi:hypothetical protein
LRVSKVKKLLNWHGMMTDENLAIRDGLNELCRVSRVKADSRLCVEVLIDNLSEINTGSLTIARLPYCFVSFHLLILIGRGLNLHMA